jgi:predicted O-methyltransferase YrrM
MDYNKSFSYINSLNFNKDSELILFYDEIINFDNEHFIPAISFDTALFLNWFCNIVKPKNILEIGFGSGASSLFIHKNLNNIKNFISLEKDKNRYNRGLNLLSKFNITNINIIHQDAFKFLENNDLNFDLIFLDAMKKDYCDYLPLLKKILNKDGVLIADNLLFNGKVIDADLENKYLNGVNFIKKFTKMIIEDGDFDTLFLNIGDGISVSHKK